MSELNEWDTVEEELIEYPLINVLEDACERVDYQQRWLMICEARQVDTTSKRWLKQQHRVDTARARHHFWDGIDVAYMDVLGGADGRVFLQDNIGGVDALNVMFRLGNNLRKIEYEFRHIAHRTSNRINHHAVTEYNKLDAQCTFLTNVIYAGTKPYIG